MSANHPKSIEENKVHPFSSFLANRKYSKTKIL